MTISTGVFLVDLLGIATSVIAVIYAYFKWSLQYWTRRSIPQLEPTIPFGTIQNPFTKTISWLEEFNILYKKAKANGWKHCGIYRLSAPIYFPIDLDLIKNLLTRDFQYFIERGLYINEEREPISCHLINVGGQKWRNLRTKLTPAFTSGKLKAMFQTLVDCGLALEKYFDEFDKKTAIDIKDVLGCFTTDIIGSCAFGIECNSLNDPDCLFRIYSKKLFNKSRFDTLKESFSHDYPATARTLRIRAYPKDVSDFFTRVIEDTVAYREKNDFVRKDCLQLLLDIKNNKEVDENYKGDGTSLTLSEIVSQSAMFFNAGFETSATTMTFAMYELATHPEIQKKVREEVRTVLAKHDNQIMYDSVSDMKYLGQVIDETMRMYPAAPFTVRKCVQDYKVPDTNAIIEKGTRVIIPICAIHRDEDYYKNPGVFDPDRFSEENKKGRHPFAHMPFGEGPRICIGQRFGMMQIRVGLTCVLRNFKFTLNKKTNIPIKLSPKTFVLTALDTIWLDVERT